MKYEFTGETKEYEGRTLKRIIRISDGLVGGWIEHERNLSHEGNCFVSVNAHVFENACVSVNAHVFGIARVFGSASLSGNTRVSDNARVYDNAYLCGNAHVCGNAEVFDNAKVYGKARVSGDAHVSLNAHVCAKCTKTPIFISGLQWPVTITDDHIKIGCRLHTKEEWRNFTDNEIAKMNKKALKFWKESKNMILA